jgi:hypothetical protein
MPLEPKDLIGIYAAVIATLNVAWSIWRYGSDKRRNEALASQEALRELSVKHIRFRQAVQEIRRRQKYLESKISDTTARARLDEIGKLFPNVDLWYFNDRAQIDRPKLVIDRLKQEPMHKRIDELLAHVMNMQVQLIQFEEQQGLGNATSGLA